MNFEETWDILATAFAEIHTKNASKLSFEELFRHAYKLVLKKKGDLLYDKVTGLEEAWLKSDVRARVTSMVSPSINLGPDASQDASSTERRVAGERFMQTLKETYSDHILCVGMITDVLMYMVSTRLPLAACRRFD